MITKKCLIESILWLGLMLLFNSVISARTIIVDTSGNGGYLTISEGMAAASSGDTVYVMPGTYYDHGIRMKENVVLQGAGADKCIIDGGNTYYGWHDNFVIYCDSVTGANIDGFTITYRKGGGIGCLWIIPTITNNQIKDCYIDGIYIVCHYPIDQRPIISGNTISGNGLGLYYMLEGLEYSTVDTLDASNNWWGTTVESEIQAGIREIEGPYMYYYVHYSPWLTEPIDSLSQLEEGLHWNNIYGNRELNLCIADIRLSIEEKLPVSIPDHSCLFQNYPNPFNSSTRINFTLPAQERVSLIIYNILGQEVIELCDGEFPAGEYSVFWQGKNHSGEQVPSGIYFARLKSGQKNRVIKLLLIE